MLIFFTAFDPSRFDLSAGRRRILPLRRGKKIFRVNTEDARIQSRKAITSLKQPRYVYIYMRVTREKRYTRVAPKRDVQARDGDVMKTERRL